MKKIVFTLFMLFTLANTFAQVDKPVVVGGNQKGDDNATMEILSKNGTKGFMPPRFTAAQMTVLQPALTMTNKGLTVFNTDENCLQTWKGAAWSECDAITLAKFTFDCSTATVVKGSYYTGVPVGINNYIEITATVVKPGTYTFYTETQDGVRFSYTGIVATIPSGPIKIQIPALGTPADVNPAVAYKVYDQSGKEVCSSSNFTIPVTENNADFNVSCDDTQPVGTFTEDQPVNPVINGVSLQLDVSDSGYYSLHTNVVGSGGADTGMWFEGTGYVSTSSAARITLTAKGTPKWGTDGKLTFTLYDKNNAAVGCTFTISLQSVKGGYTPDCTVTGTVVNGVFVETKPASANNYITLNVNVTKPGPWKISTDVIRGVYFNGVGTFDELGNQSITLVSNGSPEASSVGLYTFKLLDAANKNTVLCTPASKIEIQANQATMICNAPYTVINSTMKVNTTVSGAAATITVPVDFTSTGPYNISATAAGVTLRASGTVSQIATPTNVNFTAVGKPSQADNVDGIPFTFSDALGTSCVRNIKIVPTKGSIKTYPATSCKEAMADNGGPGIAPNGEYWVKPTLYTGAAMKTLCDMSNGQTMVWSYSEQTARNVYMTATSGISSAYSFNKDMPLNNDNYGNETVNYTNFRMSKTAMAAIGLDNGTLTGGLTGTSTNANTKWRFRVVSSLANASKIDDANAQNNYIEFNPYNGYAFTGSSGDRDGAHYFTGKLNGKAISYSPGRYDGQNASTYFNGGPVSETIYGYTGSPSGQPNYFGGFGSSAEVSGHFFICNNGQQTCGPKNLIVSPNNKVIQVFIF